MPGTRSSPPARTGGGGGHRDLHLPARIGPHRDVAIPVGERDADDPLVLVEGAGGHGEAGGLELVLVCDEFGVGAIAGPHHRVTEPEDLDDLQAGRGRDPRPLRRPRGVRAEALRGDAADVEGAGATSELQAELVVPLDRTDRIPLARPGPPLGAPRVGRVLVRLTPDPASPHPPRAAATASTTIHGTHAIVSPVDRSPGLFPISERSPAAPARQGWGRSSATPSP